MYSETIPLIRAVYLKRLSETLFESKLDHRSGLNYFGLPEILLADSHAYAPLIQIVGFMRWAEIHSANPGIGAQAGARLEFTDFSSEMRAALSRAATVEEALGAYCQHAEREWAPARCSLEWRGQHIRVTSAARYCENLVTGLDWLFVNSVMAVANSAKGNTYGRNITPRAISVRSLNDPVHSRTALTRCPGVRIRLGEPATFVEFDTADLGLVFDLTTAATDQVARTELVWDFPSSLASVLEPHLEDGYPSIADAAAITGCSVRTLQRRLKAFNLTYTEVVQDLRLKAARRVLRDPAKKIIDAAGAVGYEDPSHFARAFRRTTGMSPREYRISALA